jgi:small conductance mechanosensitive channel
MSEREDFGGQPRHLRRELILPTRTGDASASWRGALAARARAALIALALATAGAAPALAEMPAAKSSSDNSQVTVKDLESLVSTIEDPAKREQLLTQLKALIAAQKGKAATEAPNTGLSAMLATLSERVRAASADLVDTATLVLNLPALWRWAGYTAADPEARARGLAGFAELIAVLGLGALAGWVVALTLRRPRRALDARVAHGFLVQLPLVLGAALLDFLPLAAFAAVAYGLLPVIGPTSSVRLIALALINASVIARGVAIVARVVLALSSDARRLLPIASETAAYNYVWIKRFAAVIVYGYFGLETAQLLGLPHSLYGLFRNLAGLLLSALLIVFILQVRRSIAQRLRGRHGDDGTTGLRLLRARLADIWHVLAIGYVVVGFVVWALRIHGGSSFVLRGTLLTLLILGLAQLAVMGVRHLVDWLFAIGKDLRERYPMLQARADRYLPFVQGVLRWVVYAFVALAVLQAWGVDSFAWLATPEGREVVGRFFSIAVVVVVALIVWEMISVVIERRLSRLDTARGRMSSARLRTLLPFARRALLVTLIVMVGLIVLSEIGIDTAPLIAGAGVIGIAIGFGAQSLVKDVITGIFILMEDSIAVGDIADLGGHSGVVESMTMRSVRLRDYDGHVHTVPFSAVTTVRNMTKDFSFAVFNIGVAYRENVDDVIAVMRDVAESLRKDADYAPYILEALDVGGLDKFGDSSVMIIARLKVLPAQQWRIGREYNRRLKAEFDRRGIEIPFPQQTVWPGVDKAGNAPAMRVELEGRASEAPPGGDKEAARDVGGAQRKPS